MAWDPIDEAELNPGYPVLKHMRKAWNSLLWLYGQIGTAVAGGIQNGSFEVDADSGGVPDGWTWSTYPGGSIALDTTTPAHGSQAVKITHPGGAGNGGGTLTSDYIICDQLVQQYIGFIHWATAAGMKNRVQVKYYDKGKVLLSTATLYESTANPTSAKYYICGFTPPASARYYRLVLSGGVNDTNVAGSAYFDGFRSAGLEGLLGVSVAFAAISEQGSGYSGGYVDVASVSFDTTVAGFPVALIFSAELRTSTDGVPAYMRFRVGSEYSNVVTNDVTTYSSSIYVLNFTPTAAGPVTVYMQLQSTGSSSAWGRKTGTTAVQKYV